MIHRSPYFLLDTKGRAVFDENGKELRITGNAYRVLVFLCENQQGTVSEIGAYLDWAKDYDENHIRQYRYKINSIIGREVVQYKNGVYSLIGEIKAEEGRNTDFLQSKSVPSGNMNNRKEIPFTWIPGVIAITALLASFFPWPYVYFVLLRFLVTGVVGYYAFYLYSKGLLNLWFWALLGIAVLFNPIIPVYLGNKALWGVIDVLVSIFLVTFFTQQNRQLKLSPQGFIQVPVLLIAFVSILTASAGTGLVLQKQEKLLDPLNSIVSKVFVNEEKRIANELQKKGGEIAEEEDKSLKLITEAEKLAHAASKTTDEQEKLRLQVQAEQARKEAEETRKLVEQLREEIKETQAELKEQSKQSSSKTSTDSSLNPIIEKISPSELLSNIDPNLTINGSDFQEGAEILVGDISFGKAHFVNSRTLTIKFTRGYLFPGSYDVEIKNPDGSRAALTNAFTILDAATQIQNQSSQTNNVQKFSTEEIVNETKQAVVQIKNGGGLGSGFIIDSVGHILTNEHVIEGSSTVEVKLDSGSIVPGTVIGWNKVKDLGLVKIDSAPSYLSLGNSTNVNVGEKAVALGYPLSSFPGTLTVAEGIVSSRGKTYGNNVSYVQTSAPIQKGSSGGPLVNKYGEVIGINTWCTTYIFVALCVDDLRFAIEINEAKSILAELKAGMKVGLPIPKTQAQTSAQKPEPIDPGNLSSALDSSSPLSRIVIAGTTKQALATFRLSETTGNEDLDVDSVTLNVTGNDVVIQYSIEVDGKTVGIAAGGGTATFNINFADGAITIPKGGNKKLLVKADFASTDIQAANNDKVIQVSLAGTKATGISTDKIFTTSDIHTGNTHRYFKTAPIFTVNSGAPSGSLIPSSNTTVAIFDLRINGTADIAFSNEDNNRLEIKISQSVNDRDDDIEVVKLIENSTGTELDSKHVDLGGNETVSVIFDFSLNNFVIPSGQTKSLKIIADTTEFEDQGDTIQVFLDDAASLNWSMDGAGNYSVTEIIWKGDIFSNALVRP